MDEAGAAADFGRVAVGQPDGFDLLVPADDEGVAVDDARADDDVGMRAGQPGAADGHDDQGDGE
jgi:hypothetical protein